MTGMLASVNCLDEAMLVMGEKVDIIDLKEPKAGSLGSLPDSLVKEIVKEVGGRCLVSATIGDLPMQPEIIYKAAKAMAETGVDYVKIGIFPDGDAASVLQKLKPLAVSHKLIAVLFADKFPGLKFIDKIKSAGFSGVMLDSLDKTKGSLSRIMPLPEIDRFVRYANSRQLICGLAGSLRQEDVRILLPLRPDYLGFRGGLCEKQDRTERIDGPVVRKIRMSIAELS